jgi:uncharacterized membrane protein YhaH (DUF805 family)
LEGAAMRFLPQGSTGIWALLIFTTWMIIMWATTASIAPIVLWFIGLLVVLLLRLISRPKQNVRIYGPNGQEWVVSAMSAARRVRNGWSYQPLASRP